MREICQDKLPFYPWLEEKLRRLPGMQVMDPADWLVVDEAYGPQMTYREELLAERRDQVYQMSDAATPAAEEVLDMTVDEGLAGQVILTGHDADAHGRGAFPWFRACLAAPPDCRKRGLSDRS